MKKTLSLVLLLVLAVSAGAGIALIKNGDKNINKDLVKAVPGQKFSVKLESNPTTGYSWQVSRPFNGKVIKLLGSKYVPGKTGLVGSGGVEIWNFKAVKPGKTSVAFKYSRPWEKDKPPVKTRTVTVEVIKK